MALLDMLNERMVEPIEPGSQQERTAKALIQDATMLVADMTGWKPEEVDKWPYMAQVIVLNAAKRVLTNPNGIKYEQIGPYAYTRDGETASGTLWLSKLEKEWLLKKLGKSGLSSVRVHRDSIAPASFNGPWSGHAASVER